jgi:hypothetical protein
LAGRAVRSRAPLGVALSPDAATASVPRYQVTMQCPRDYSGRRRVSIWNGARSNPGAQFSREGMRSWPRAAAAGSTLLQSAPGLRARHKGWTAGEFVLDGGATFAQTRTFYSAAPSYRWASVGCEPARKRASVRRAMRLAPMFADARSGSLFPFWFWSGRTKIPGQVPRIDQRLTLAPFLTAAMPAYRHFH